MTLSLIDGTIATARQDAAAVRRELLGCLVALIGLVLLLPSPASMVRLLLGEPAAIAGDGATVAALVVATAAVWAVLATLAGVLAVAMLARLPGRWGRCSRVVLRCLVPHRWQAWTGAVVGVALLAGTAACGHPDPTATPAPPSPSVAGTVTSDVALTVEGLDWPTSTPSSDTEGPSEPVPGVPTEVDSPGPGPVPVPTASPAGTPTTDHPPTVPPTATGPATAPSAVEPKAAGPIPTHPTPTHPTPITAPPVRPAASVVIVRAGDSLWRIAARYLPAGADARTIDAAWRQWYATNRALIGPDPDLILPGQQLRAPDAEVTP